MKYISLFFAGGQEPTSVFVSDADQDTIFPTTAQPLTDEKLHKHNESSESKNKGHWEPLVEKIPKKHCPQ